ncbi:hypothetical protein E2C01_001343 [Portunus trituberculatus]|uniref:Uncharacterized protein n=1 Tax=Portunus trituberculatus TaxID=210409 RepID=A0A5B7CH22_PORTR|nr:hypothetical protein [Portunus trituberculatus]
MRWMVSTKFGVLLVSPGELVPTLLSSRCLLYSGGGGNVRRERRKKERNEARRSVNPLSDLQKLM